MKWSWPNQHTRSVRDELWYISRGTGAGIKKSTALRYLQDELPMSERPFSEIEFEIN